MAIGFTALGHVVQPIINIAKKMFKLLGQYNTPRQSILTVN